MHPMPETALQAPCANVAVLTVPCSQNAAQQGEHAAGDLLCFNPLAICEQPHLVIILQGVWLIKGINKLMQLDGGLFHASFMCPPAPTEQCSPIGPYIQTFAHIWQTVLYSTCAGVVWLGGTLLVRPRYLLTDYRLLSSPVD